MTRTPRRALLGLVLGWAGCARASDLPTRTDLDHPRVVAACSCFADAADAHLKHILSLMSGDSTAVERTLSVARCSAQTVGHPSATPSMTAPERSIRDYFAPLKGTLVMTEEGFLDVRPQPYDGDYTWLDHIGRAIHEAFVAQQMCAACSLAIAVTASIEPSAEAPVSLGVIHEAEQRVRTAFAVGVALAQVIDVALRRGTPEPVVVAARRLRSVDDAGSFDQDPSALLRRAAHIRQAHLEASSERRQDTTHIPMPGSMSGTPWLGLLVSAREQPKDRAARDLVDGLARRDVGQVAIAAAPLHETKTDAARTLAAGALLLRGEIARAGATARELVPFFTDTATILAEIAAGSPGAP